MSACVREYRCVCVLLYSFQLKRRSGLPFKVRIENMGVMLRKANDVQSSTLVKY